MRQPISLIVARETLHRSDIRLTSYRGREFKVEKPRGSDFCPLVDARRQVKAKKIPKCSLPLSGLSGAPLIGLLPNSRLGCTYRDCVATLQHHADTACFRSIFFFSFLSASFFLPFFLFPPFRFSDKENGRKRLSGPKSLVGTKFKERGEKQRDDVGW